MGPAQLSGKLKQKHGGLLGLGQQRQEARFRETWAQLHHKPLFAPVYPRGLRNILLCLWAHCRRAIGRTTEMVVAAAHVILTPVGFYPFIIWEKTEGLGKQ